MSVEVIKTGTSVILHRGSRVLVGVRQGSHGAGMWAFPGGHIELDDASLKVAGEREVGQETGITCNIYRPDGIRDDLFTTFDILGANGTKRYVTTYLTAAYVSGGTFTDNRTITGCEPDKCVEWKWVTLDELSLMVRANGDGAWIPLNKVVPLVGGLNLRDTAAKKIPFNIWDDYYDDGHVPEGKSQKTEGFVEDPEDELPSDLERETLELVHGYIRTLDLDGGRCRIRLYGKGIEFLHLTHERRERLIEELEAANLHCGGLPIEFYSES